MKELLLFIHGLGGGETTWGEFARLISEDERLNGEFDVGFYVYPTSLVRLPFTKKPLSIQTLAQGLESQIDYRFANYSSIVLICHSLGGLIARRYLIDQIKKQRKLKCKRLLLYAVPNNGSSLALVARQISWRHSQLRQLCSNSDLINDLNNDWFLFKAPEQLTTKYVVAGLDRVVDARSAKSFWGNTDVVMIVDKGHTDVVKPTNSYDFSFQILKRFVLEPIRERDSVAPTDRLQEREVHEELSQHGAALPLSITDIDKRYALKPTTRIKRDISVFMASPGDLANERLEFRDAIDQLNKGFGDGAGVSFKALGWEDTLASTGRRPQNVINQEIDRCDVFVLLLHRRWGQDAPDSKYTSYTEEEFHRAFDRMQVEGVPEIYIFLKRVDPESEADAGPQLLKVMDFRRQLEDSRQILYRYVDDDQKAFAREVDRHLRSFAKSELLSRGRAAEARTQPTKVVDVAKASPQITEMKEHVENLALQMAKDAAESANDGKLEKARQQFALATAGTSNTQILLLAANFYVRTGDTKAAGTLLKRTGVTEETAIALRQLGMLHETRGELGEAERAYRRVLAMNQKLGRREGMANAYLNLGNVHETRGNLSRAEEMYGKALAVEVNQ